MLQMIGGKRLFIIALSCILIFGDEITGAQTHPELNQSGLRDNFENRFLKFNADGSVHGWDIDIAEGQNIPVVDQRQGRLLALKVILNKRDITNEIAWKMTSEFDQNTIVFVGTQQPSGLRIIRKYTAGANNYEIGTSLQFVFEGLGNNGELEAILAIPNALKTHLTNDRSLGDYFYSFRRTFYSHGNGAYQRYSGEKDQFVDSIAFSSRHVGLRVTQVNESLGRQFHLSPISPATISLVAPSRAEDDYDQNAYSMAFVLSARPMMSSVVANTNFQNMLFADMWFPLKLVAQLIDRSIQSLTSMFGSLGISVVAFALLLRLLLLPITIWSVRQQMSFATVQANMAPQIDEINAAFKGAERSERTLELYKKYKISPFTGLKGSTALFVQLPILIAFFSITAESALFRDIPFLWITDLSLPDRLYRLPISIPGMGSFVNFLPITLGLVSVIASILQQKSSDVSSVRISRGSLLLVLLIVLFFYSCASALVLYWTVANIAQILEGQYVRFRDKPALKYTN